MSDAGGLITADALIERYAGGGPVLSVAERAAEDRTWTFGHILVDEAQELSAMAWRLLMRRGPNKSMTVVGDLAQTGALGGARSWAQVLDPHAAGRWAVAELTINYRTPGLIMDVASRMLEDSGVQTTPPTSAREGRWPPSALRVDAYDGAELAALVLDELARVEPGRVAVLTPRHLRDQVSASLRRQLGAISVGSGAEGLQTPVVVLSVAEAKGLEFDAVVLLDPADVLAGSPRGANDLYVAMTRPTQRLVVVHTGELPATLHDLAPHPAGAE